MVTGYRRPLGQILLEAKNKNKGLFFFFFQILKWVYRSLLQKGTCHLFPLLLGISTIVCLLKETHKTRRPVSLTHALQEAPNLQQMALCFSARPRRRAPSSTPYVCPPWKGCAAVHTPWPQHHPGRPRCLCFETRDTVSENINFSLICHEALTAAIPFRKRWHRPQHRSSTPGEQPPASDLRSSKDQAIASIQTDLTGPGANHGYTSTNPK